MQAKLKPVGEGVYWVYHRRFLDEEPQLMQNLQTIIDPFVEQKRTFFLVIDLSGIRILLREDRLLIGKVSMYCQDRGMNRQYYIVDSWKVNKMKIQAKLHNMPYHEAFYGKNDDIEEMIGTQCLHLP